VDLEAGMVDLVEGTVDLVGGKRVDSVPQFVLNAP